jgi:DNA-binding protein YbaB
MTVELTDEEYERLQAQDEKASELEDEFHEIQNELYETARQYDHLAEILFRIKMEIESLAIDDEYLAEIREDVRSGEGLYEKVNDESR